MFITITIKYWFRGRVHVDSKPKAGGVWCFGKHQTPPAFNQNNFKTPNFIHE